MFVRRGKIVFREIWELRRIEEYGDLKMQDRENLSKINLQHRFAFIQENIK
jgi:hypothetical protein